MRIRELDAAGLDLDPRHTTYEDDDYTDVNEDEEYYSEEEAFESDARGQMQRPSISSRLLGALKPAALKKRLQGATTDLAGKGWRVASVAGNLAWIVTTSMLLVGLPVLYAYDREKNAAAQGGMVPLDAATDAALD